MNYMLAAQEAMKHALAATPLPSITTNERAHILTFLENYCLKGCINLVIGPEHIKTLIEQLHHSSIFHFMMPLSYRFRAFYGTDVNMERGLVKTLAEVLAAPPEVTNRPDGSTSILNKEISAKLNLVSENESLLHDNQMILTLIVLNVSGLGSAYFSAGQEALRRASRAPGVRTRRTRAQAGADE